MTHIKLFIFTVLSGLFVFDGNAQTIRDTSRLTTKEAMRYYESPYYMDPPDTSFTPILNPLGWEEKTTESRIFCLVMPWSFESMVNDTKTKHGATDKGLTVLSSENLEINGMKGMLVKSEGESSPENKYLLNYYRPIDEKTTLMVVAVYPKSQDDRLYKKIVAALGTARKKG